MDGRGRGPQVVAAFEPFGGRRRNRSLEAMSALRDRPDLVRVLLPVVFARLPAAIDELFAFGPRAVLLVGESGRWQALAVERLARNLAHARIADNEGARPLGQPIVPGAPDVCAATWDAARVASALRRAGLPAEISHHAGAFCCNASLFLALSRAPAPAPPIGFLHVPAAPWPLGPTREKLVRALEIALLTMTHPYAI